MKRIARPAIAGVHPVLITGGAGFIGSNLADRLARQGHHVLVYDALLRPGVEANLSWLKRRHPRQVTACIADIRDGVALEAAVADAQAAFHLAGQVAVTTSLTDPREDFDVNLAGTFHLLDALRRRAEPMPLIFASTNKVYGDLADIALQQVDDAYLPVNPDLRATGIDEARPLDFRTPYGCSKGAADQYVLDFGRSYGFPTTVLRMSCIYGERQMGTEDQGWVAHFLMRALRGESISIYGDGCQVRDVLDVQDAVTAYVESWRRIDRVRGEAFNLGGGPRNAISLRQLVTHLSGLLGHSVSLRHAEWRPGDQRYFVSDTRRIRAALDLPLPKPWREGVDGLVQWLRGEPRIPAPAEVVLP